MNKRFIAIIALCIVVVGGFMVATKPKASTSTGTGQLSNHIVGKGSSGITLIEYGDYQCPACFQYYPLAKSVAETYKDQIFFQFRNFPLESLHPNARAGARAAEAADKQGKFWEMHDILYENADPQGRTGWVVSGDPLNAYFTGFAEKIGITGANLDKFKQDFASAEVNSIISADLREGGKLNITGTPTFFLDGKKITNPRDQASFNKLIDDEIAAKTKKTSN